MPQETRTQPVALFLAQTYALYPSWEVLRAVDERFPVARHDVTKSFEEQVQGVRVIVDDGGSQGTHAMVDASCAAGVQLWQVTTNGLDHVDIAYFMEKGMPLAHAAGPQSAVALAEHSLSIILYFAKNLHLNHAAHWTHRTLNSELGGQVLGLVGLGASGQALAQRAACLGMRIMAVDAVEISQAVRDELRVEFFGGPAELVEMAAQSDYLSVHVPNTSKTRHLIDGRVLGAMKSSAVVINVARGEIIDEKALIAALDAGQLKGAGLDVFDQEPPDASNPLLSMPNVVATPHIAGVTGGTFRRRAEAAAENIARILQGAVPYDLVRAVE